MVASLVVVADDISKNWVPHPPVTTVSERNVCIINRADAVLIEVL